MPQNELEIHPYLHCIKDDKFESTYFENIIIGTFPIYSITDTINEKGEIISRFEEQTANMRFFYGSKKNSFWKLFSQALEENNPTNFPSKDRCNKAIELLVKNKFLITDVVYKTNRKNENSEDSDLWVTTEDKFVNENRSLNYNIIELLNKNPNIKNLYFTATGLNGNSPFGWFREIFGNTLQYKITLQVENRLISATITINNRTFNAFFLPSPAGSGTRGLHFNKQKTQIFVNYIKSVAPEFYDVIDMLKEEERNQIQKDKLTQFRKEFLLESWSQVLVNKNSYFDGTI